VIYKVDEYDEAPEEELIRQYDRDIMEYYILRTKGKKTDTWTKTVASRLDKEVRPHMRMFLSDKGFDMK